MLASILPHNRIVVMRRFFRRPTPGAFALDAINKNTRAPRPLIPMRALKPLPALVNNPVQGILRRRDNTQVLAPIVERIAVDVIDNLTIFRAGNQAMQQQVGIKPFRSN